MELFLDTADAVRIAELNRMLPLAGVTTNPSIIAASGKAPEEAVREIDAVLDKRQKLCVQAVSGSVEGILEEARMIRGMRPKPENGEENLFIKIPVTHEGMEAIRKCKQLGFGVLATAVFSAEQAYFAAENGADYLAPYVNRMDRYTDGIREVVDLLVMLEKNRLPAKVIAASLKNQDQVRRLMVAGIHAITITPDLALSLIGHPGTEEAVEAFSSAWRTAFKRDTL